jgi:hypothetical protein
VVNYKRGDGLEKAIVMLNALRSRKINARIRQSGNKITITSSGTGFEYDSCKSLILPEFFFEH